ncbi:hypothetical protein B0T13DRAFT_521847 [Neurospora crassa]|nr:hypothetical protein B0T13DRAFT_521847 [Neurospora crassa]
MQLSLIFSGLLPGLLLLPSFCLSQDVPFDVDGGLEGCTITDTGTYNSGGTISVAGWTIKVPQNTQVGFPAAWVSWREFCADIAFMRGFEITVVGNVIPLHGPTAGQIFISQFSTSFGRGLISSISYDDGSIQLSQGPKLRINDPHGVYSVGYTSHPLWTADDENPSISSFSGFPMCVPRNGSDPLCPTTNRPTLGGSSKQGTFTAPDPMVMAPFVPGDFVEYAGVWVAGGEMLVYELVATNVQILTPASFPAFIRMEDVLIGVYSGDVNAEVAQTRFIGYTSAASGTSTLTIHAVTGFDVCTGNITTRPVSGGSLIAGQVRNKFRTGITSVAGDVYAREYVILSTTNPVRTKNGILVAGQYIQPVTEWIQPELTTPGLPPIPNDFSAMEHLVKGLGGDEEGHVWGPLEPFPQSGVMVSAPAPVVNDRNPPLSLPLPLLQPPLPPPATTKDIINIISATWISSGSGTLTVTCTSSNTNNTAVGMLLDTPVQMGLVMTGSTSNPGTWTFSSVKIKQVASVTCRSKLGGSATGQVVGKGKRDGDGNGDGEGIERRRWTVGRRGVRRRGGVGSGGM